MKRIIFIGMGLCILLLGSCENTENLYNLPTAKITNTTVPYVGSSKAVVRVNAHYGGNIRYTAVQYGVYYSSSNTEPTANDNVVWKSGFGGYGEFEMDLKDLTPNTTYYARAFIGTNFNTLVGDVVSFKTADTIYTVSQIMSIYYSLGLANGAISTNSYTVRGYVTQWKSGYPEFPNADFWIDDSSTGSTSMLMCYRLTGLNESDRRTLKVGDYIEAQNCHLQNFNGKAELKDGTYTVIKAK